MVAIGVMDVDDYLSRNPTGSNGTVRLVNIYGFFVEGMGDVDRRRRDDAERRRQGGDRPADQDPVDGRRDVAADGRSSFLVKIILVR